MVKKQQHIDYLKSNVLNVTSPAIFVAGHRPWQTGEAKQGKRALTLTIASPASACQFGNMGSAQKIIKKT